MLSRRLAVNQVKKKILLNKDEEMSEDKRRHHNCQPWTTLTSQRNAGCLVGEFQTGSWGIKCKKRNRK